MTRSLTFIFMAVLSIAADSQSLFFDNFRQGEWISGEFTDETTIKEAGTIELIRRSPSNDTLMGNCTIWDFKDKLVVTFYDAAAGYTRVIGSYPYHHDRQGGLLIITFHPDQRIAYRVGIVSTGNFACLMKNKRRSVGSNR